MRIDSMLPSKRVRGRWLCHMEDGSILRVGEGEVASFSLHTGMELSTEILAALNSATVRSTLREKALALIAARPLSRKELVDKLAAKAEGEGARSGRPPPPLRRPGPPGLWLGRRKRGLAPLRRRAGGIARSS